MFPSEYTPILKFFNSNDKTKPDTFVLKELIQGLFVFGASGSGKTSGIGQQLIAELMEHNFGGLVLTAKSEETKMWLDYAKSLNRLHDVIKIDEHGAYGFNFLDYEMHRTSRGAGLTENIYELFDEVSTVMSGKKDKTDDVWSKASKQLFKSTIDVLKEFTPQLSIDDMQNLVGTFPREDSHWNDESRFFVKLYKHINAFSVQNPNFVNTDRGRGVVQALNYFQNEYTPMPQRQRDGVNLGYNALLSPFTSGIVHPLLCAKTNVTPEDTFNGKIIILDIPSMNFNKAGKTVQLIWKLMWQRAVRARDVSHNKRPVFLWADECQEFITSTDQEFLNVMRGKLGTMVYLTQSKSVMDKKLGETNSKAVLDSFQHFVFHQNSGHATNSWAADRISRTWQDAVSINQQNTGDAERGGSSLSEALRHDVEPTVFRSLRNGFEGDGRVDGIFYRGTRKWLQTDEHFRLVTFNQNFIRDEFP